MKNNWAFLIWIGVASMVCNFAHGERRELVNGKSEWRVKLLWATVIFAPVAVCAAMRGFHEGDIGTKIAAPPATLGPPAFSMHPAEAMPGAPGMAEAQAGVHPTS